MSSLTELEEFFKTAVIPDQIQLTEAENIFSVQEFIDGHLLVAKAYGHLPMFKIFEDRLNLLKDRLEGQQLG
jgi:hypothetical protein